MIKYKKFWSCWKPESDKFHRQICQSISKYFLNRHIKMPYVPTDFEPKLTTKTLPGGWTKATKFIGKYVDPYQRISWTGISKSHMCRLIWAQSNYWNTTRQLKVSGETLNFLWYATEIGHVCVLPFLELCKCYSINNNSCVCRFKYILQGFWLVAIDDLSATKTWC